MKKFFYSVYRVLISMGVLCGILLANSMYAHGCTPFGIAGPSDNFGRAKGKIGQQIQYQKYGRTIIRDRIAPGSYHKPDTMDFALRTERFTFALNLARQLRPWAKMLVIPRLGFKSCFNSVMGFVTLAWDYSGGSTNLWTPKGKQSSKGMLPLSTYVSATPVTGYIISMVWSDILTTPDELITDKAYFIISDEDGNYATLVNTGKERGDAGGAVQVPVYMQSMKIFVSSVVFVSADGKKVSDSVFSQSDTAITLVP